MSSKRSSRDQAKTKQSPEQVPGVGTSRKDEIIVVLGRAGSGKSTFVQMATSVPQEISNINNSLKATTTSVNVVRAKASNGNEESGDRTVIIDTPGVENGILLDQPMFVEVGEKTKTNLPVRITGSARKRDRVSYSASSGYSSYQCSSAMSSRSSSSGNGRLFEVRAINEGLSIIAKFPAKYCEALKTRGTKEGLNSVFQRPRQCRPLPSEVDQGQHT
ncbi:hypothetical protein PLEOSDRAFT_174841 [Pleurotus ostreatus PC15]|uniref:G domain-containing protein n=1 Tax=Pleurotus ostreatus (strain PC15) TaxID=1137138 RepID=A0A067NFZ6_PLEO1|nr:hypothetical protein PLEOSDRAFT_174841 [Pleurotus ostreatus PC15]